MRTVAGVNLRAGVPGTNGATNGASPVYYLTNGASIILLTLHPFWFKFASNLYPLRSICDGRSDFLQWPYRRRSLQAGPWGEENKYSWEMQERRALQ